MSTNSIFLWMIATIIGLLVAVKGLFAVVEYRRRRLLQRTGRRADGHVLASGHDSVDLGGEQYWVEVQYIHDSGPVTVRVPVGQRDRQRYRDHSRVGLTYAPSRLDVVTLDPPR